MLWYRQQSHHCILISVHLNLAKAVSFLTVFQSGVLVKSLDCHYTHNLCWHETTIELLFSIPAMCVDLTLSGIQHLSEYCMGPCNMYLQMTVSFWGWSIKFLEIFQTMDTFFDVSFNFCLELTLEAVAKSQFCQCAAKVCS